MATFNNMSLYIKRADLHCTKEYMADIFSSNSVGIVKDVKFIKKSDSFGREYNGAIIIFESWFMNARVTQLLNDMGASVDGTTKFTYDHQNHYWYINVHKQVLIECETQTMVDPTLPDKQRIIKLEKLSQTMVAQLHYSQLRQERLERQLMKTEEKESHHALCNVELRFKLEDKDMDIEWLRSDNEKAVKAVKDECVILKTRLASMAIDLARKDEELKNASYRPLTGEMNVGELA